MDTMRLSEIRQFMHNMKKNQAQQEQAVSW